MAESVLRSRSTIFRAPRWLAATTAAALVGLGLPLITATTASAAGGIAGNFEIDGNFAVDNAANIDWASAAVTSGKVQGADGIGVADTSVFQTSSKESNAPSTWKLQNNNTDSKNDIGGYWTYNQSFGGHDWLYFAFDRVSPNGTDFQYLELNKLANVVNGNGASVPNRSVGDVRFTFHDQGGGVVGLDAADTWNGSAWVGGSIPANSFYGAANTASVTLPSGYTSPNGPTLGADTFIETAFDLTALLGIHPGCPPSPLSQLNFRNATGNSNENLKEFVAPLGIQLASTCATLQIEKKNADGSAYLAGATFTITPNPTTGSGSLDVTDNDSNDANPADGRVTVNNVQPGTYSIAEKTAPAGYILITPNAQSVTAHASTVEPAVVFYDPLGAISWTKSYEGGLPDGFTGATFSVQRTSGAGSFGTITGKSNPFTVVDNGTNDENPAVGALKVTGLPVGAYTVTETAAPVGFAKDATVGNVTIPTTASSIANAQAPHAVDHAFSDPRLTASLKVKKLSAETQGAIQGAEFKLWQVVGSADNGGAPHDDTDLGNCTTAADGTCTKSGLAWGASYYWQEISVPFPYNLPANVYSATVAVTAQDATDQVVHLSTFSDLQSHIVTSATPTVKLPGSPIHDTATLTGVRSDAGGSITFNLYGPADQTCSLQPLHVFGPINIQGHFSAGQFVVSSGDYVPVDAGTYHWIASYSGDANTGQLGVSGQCGDSNETTVVTPATPGISTTASAVDPAQDGKSYLPDNATIRDTAHLTGLTPNATGSVTFKLYGPTDPTCGGTALFTSTVGIGSVAQDGHVDVQSASYLATVAGTYHWVASYHSGDGNNTDVAGTCGDDNESWVVNKAPTSIVTSATPTAQLPSGTIHDSVTLSGLTSDATGTLTLKLYGPADATCSAAALFTQTWDVSTISARPIFVVSTNYTPLVTGTFHWVASYNGDGNNAATTGHCGDEGESSVVTKASPNLTTTASDDTTLGAGSTGAVVSDTAHLTGLSQSATGSVTFTLYGPFASEGAISCSVASAYQPNPNSLPVSGSGTVDVGPISATVHASGWYSWSAHYSGDSNNNTADGSCSDAAEHVFVAKNQPSIVTQAVATAQFAAGQSSVDISDTATVSNLTDPHGGTVTFRLYGPSDTMNCDTDAIFTSPSGVAIAPTTGSTGTASSGPVPVTQPGTYWWIATYSGDNNNKSVAGHCGDTNERTDVGKAPTQTVTTAGGGGTIGAGSDGADITDSATVSGLTSNATGTVTFDVFGPFATVADIDCTVSQVGHVVVPLGTVTNGTANVGPVHVTVAHTGIYAWIATYSGDAANAGSHDVCGSEGERSTVTPRQPGIDTTATKAVAITGGSSEQFSDTAHVTGLTAGATGTVTFKLYGPSASSAGCTALPVVYDSGALPLGSVLLGTATVNSGLTSVTQPGTYWWVASYSGDGDNNPVAGACGDPGEHTNADSLSTTASNGPDSEEGALVLPIGAATGNIHDTAHIAGLTEGATGTVTFTVYAGSCEAEGVVVGSSPVDANGNAVSPDFAAGPGTYFWAASYSGDGDNAAVSGACGDPNEESQVVQAVPHIDKQVDGVDGNGEDPHSAVPVGTVLHYTVTVSNSGSVSATGDVTDVLPTGLDAPTNVQLDGVAVASTYDSGTRTLTVADVTVDAGASRTLSYDATVNADAATTDTDSLVNHASWLNVSDETTVPVKWITPTATAFCDVNTPVVHYDVAGHNLDAGPQPVTFQWQFAGDQVVNGVQVHDGDPVPASDLATVDGVTQTLPTSWADTSTNLSGDLLYPGTKTVNGVTTDWPGWVLVNGEWQQVGDGLTPSVKLFISVADPTVGTTTAQYPPATSACFGPTPGSNPGLTKVADPASGSTVNVGDVITYTVTLSNTGTAPATGDLVDVLPNGVTYNAGTATRDGAADEPTISGQTLTWPAVTVHVGAPSVFVYQVTVTDAALAQSSLVNTAKWQGLQAQTTHLLPLPHTGAPFSPLTGVAWSTLMALIGAGLLLLGRRRRGER